MFSRKCSLFEHSLIYCVCMYVLHVHTWAPAGIFPEGGKTARTDKNDVFFSAPKARTKIFAIFSVL